MPPSASGRSANGASGEYMVPVTQGQFNTFAEEVRGFFGEQREENKAIRSMLAEGASTMAVLRSDSATFLKRSDEASSKINLLINKESVRADREKREESRSAAGIPPLKPSIWERIKDGIVEKIIGLIALAILMIVYHQVVLFVIAHPSIAPSGEGFSAPRSQPASTPALKPTPP